MNQFTLSPVITPSGFGYIQLDWYRLSQPKRQRDTKNSEFEMTGRVWREGVEMACILKGRDFQKCVPLRDSGEFEIWTEFQTARFMHICFKCCETKINFCVSNFHQLSPVTLFATVGLQNEKNRFFPLRAGLEYKVFVCPMIPWLILAWVILHFTVFSCIHCPLLR